MHRALAALAVLVALPATPSRAADPNSVIAECDWALRTIPSGEMAFVLVAQAEATGLLPALATTVSCTATTSWGERVEASGSAYGPRVVAGSGRYLRFDPPQVCFSGSAVFADPSLATYEVAAAEVCR